ncbi:thioredoxin-like protein [Gongronella butleri]|nr:thioredoxin-like protein [Gongronella butleri]
MVAPQNVTLYNYLESPYSHRVLIALKELGVTYEDKRIDLLDKPEWFANQIHPEGTVPVLEIDGVKIPESLVIVELANSLFHGSLIASDPIKRAQSLVIIDVYRNSISGLPMKVFTKELTPEQFKDQTEAVFERVHDFLLEQASEGPYFLGEQYSIADIGLAPFIFRFLAFCKHFVQGYVPEAIEKLPRLKQFIEGNRSRPSFKDTYFGDDEYIAYLLKRAALGK